jgi:hypothetical protein
MHAPAGSHDSHQTWAKSEVQRDILFLQLPESYRDLVSRTYQLVCIVKLYPGATYFELAHPSLNRV